MIERLRFWLVRRILGYEHIGLAAAIARDLEAADEAAWRGHDQLKHATVYVGPFSTFRLVIKRERHAVPKKTPRKLPKRLGQK